MSHRCPSTFASIGLAGAAALVLTSAALSQTTQPATQPTTRPATQPDTPGDRPAPVTAPDLAERNRKPTLAEQVAKAHNETAWDEQQAIAFTMDLTFGASLQVKADVTYDYHRNRVRMQMADGPLLVFDGEKAWVSPADAAFPRARFHLLTWTYFLAVPFKLDDPGTNIDERGVSRQLDRPYLSAKLTFDDGVGDAPDDWYILYVDPAGRQLRAMSYIVTYGDRDPESAEESAHAITYDGFGIYNGVVLPTEWDFYNWNEEDGIHGDVIGHVSLSEVRFVTPEEGVFDRPADSREDALPKAAGDDE